MDYTEVFKIVFTFKAPLKKFNIDWASGVTFFRFSSSFYLVYDFVIIYIVSHTLMLGCKTIFPGISNKSLVKSCKWTRGPLPQGWIPFGLRFPFLMKYFLPLELLGSFCAACGGRNGLQQSKS